MKKSSRWKPSINYRKFPLKYFYDPGIGGMYTCNPYKDEILSIVKLREKNLAIETCNNLVDMFFIFLEKKDFVGSDMVRKFLQKFSKLNNLGEVSKNFSIALEDCLNNRKYLDLKSNFLNLQRLESKLEKRRFSPF